MIERRIAAGDLAGAVTIVARKGKVVHHVAQGVMDLDSKQPMASSPMFRIASMTKPVVGVAVMMLVEEGKLHLNDPVSRYIPISGHEGGGATAAAAGGRAGGEGSAGPPRSTLSRPSATSPSRICSRTFGTRQRTDGQQ